MIRNIPKLRYKILLLVVLLLATLFTGVLPAQSVNAQGYGTEEPETALNGVNFTWGRGELRTGSNGDIICIDQQRVPSTTGIIAGSSQIETANRACAAAGHGNADSGYRIGAGGGAFGNLSPLEQRRGSDSVNEFQAINNRSSAEDNGFFLMRDADRNATCVVHLTIFVNLASVNNNSHAGRLLMRNDRAHPSSFSGRTACRDDVIETYNGRVIQIRADSADAYPPNSSLAQASAQDDDEIFERFPGGENNGGSEDAPPSCENEGADLSWVICPVIFLGDAVMRKLDQAIISLLSTPNDYLENPGLRTAWTRLRNIAYLILVPIMLIMVIGTALGFDFINAYTVKRALPRMLIAILFIALSFDICMELIKLTNAVGTGLGGLIASAVVGADEISLATVFNPDGNWESASAILLGAGALGGVAVLGGIGVVLSYILVAVVSLAVGFFLLSLRQMLVVMLMLLAPLAILAWIFPGNDKLWKLWWGTFSKLLLLFPLIVVMITTGKVFAAIIAGVPSGDAIDSSLVTTLIKLVAYVGPYFLIPAMFKFAGGLFATISGMTNDRSKGLFDRQRKFRAEKYAKNKELAASNRRWNPNSRTGKLLNSSASWIADPTNNARIAMGTQKGRAIMNQVNQQRFEETQKLAQKLSTAGFNDKALDALSIGAIMRDEKGNELLDEHGKVRRVRYDGSAASMESVLANLENGGEHEKLAAKQLRDNGAFLREVYSSEEYGRASVTGAAALSLASQGFADSEGIAQVANMLDGEDPRFQGMGSMFKTQAELLNKSGGGLTKPGNSVMLGDDGRFKAAAGVVGNHGDNIKRIQSISVGDLAQAKGPALKLLAKSYEEILKADVGTVYSTHDGGEVKITQEMKDAVTQTLFTASQSYNNPDIAAQTTAILKNGLGEEGYEGYMGRRRGGIRDDEWERGPGKPGEGPSLGPKE